MKLDPQEIVRANEYIENNGLRVTHFRYHNLDGTYQNKGGMTVVWKDSKPGRLFTISTALCNESDIFSRNIGRVLAVQNYEQGHRVQLMKSNFHTAYETICQLFLIEV